MPIVTAQFCSGKHWTTLAFPASLAISINPSPADKVGGALCEAKLPLQDAVLQAVVGVKVSRSTHHLNPTNAMSSTCLKDIFQHKTIIFVFISLNWIFHKSSSL